MYLKTIRKLGSGTIERRDRACIARCLAWPSPTKKATASPQDYNIAAITYLEAAKRGYAPAQANVGLLYTKNVPGVPQNYSLAYKWLCLAIPNLTGETQAA